MNNEPVAWMNKDDSSLSFKNHGGGWQPLYTHQYERPHNTVLVPCDKLAEMQAEIKALKADPLMYMRLNPKQELTDDEVADLVKASVAEQRAMGEARLFFFAKILLRKAQE